MKLSKDKTKVLLINHFVTTGKGTEETDQRTLNYMLDKVKKVVQISHPFPFSPTRYSIMTVYENGESIFHQKVRIPKGPDTFQYLFHAFLTFYFLLKAGIRYDLCIALEDLAFATIFPLRFFGFIRKTVYYSVDFTPKRFTNSLINQLYHFLDRFACCHSDLNWVVAKQQIDARSNYGLKIKKCANFVLTPIGYKNKEINIQPVEKINIHNLVFAGALLENSGPQLGIKALPLLINKYPKIHYNIIGKGVFGDNLQSLVKKLKVQKYVTFLGYIESFQELTSCLAKGSIGLAPFVPAPDSLSYYSDPSKIKLYLACGLPVITTKVATIAPIITKDNAGLVVDYDENKLAKAIDSLLKNRKKYELYKNGAIKLSKKYDIDYILENSFRKIP